MRDVQLRILKQCYALYQNQIDSTELFALGIEWGNEVIQVLSER